MTHLFRAAVLAASVCVLVPGAAIAQPSTAEPDWSEIEVPGSAHGFAQAAGISDATPPDQLLLGWFRVISAPDAGGQRAAKFQSYVETIARFNAVQKGVGPAFSLNDIRQRRKAYEKVVELLGLDLKGNGASLRAVPEDDHEAVASRAALASAGLDLDKAEDTLNGGGRLDIALPSFKALLPLSTSWWQRQVLHREVPAGALWEVLLTDHAALGVYYGLASAPAPTRAYVAGQPDILDFAYRERPGRFGVHIGHVRINANAVSVPGGPLARAVWEDLVGARISEPARFIRRLLTKDDGRLAVFYSTLDSMDEQHQRFALGFDTPSFRPGKFDVAHAVYNQWFKVEGTFELPEDRPFRKPVLDPSLLLGQVLLDEHDHLRGPAWTDLWVKAFDDLELPDRPRVATAARLDADDLSGLIFRPQQALDDFRSLERLQTFTFAQRTFVDATPTVAGDLLVALRGFQRFPALHLTLDRAGVRAPWIHAAAARRAAALSRLSEPDMAFDSLSQMQGGVVLVEAAVRVGSVSPAVGSDLIALLVTIDTDKDGSYGNRIVQWLDRSVLPALTGATAPIEPATIDDALLTALAGARTLLTDRFEFEGQRYTVVPSRAWLARLRALRNAQEVNTIGAIVSVSRSAEVLRASTRDALLAGLRERVVSWPALLKEPRPPTKLGDARRLTVKRAIELLDREAARVSKSRNAKVDTRPAGDTVEQLSALLAADALRSLAYALAVGDADSSLFSAGDVSHTHDFGLTVSDVANRELAVWSLPGSSESHAVRGALLGLDLALADTAMTSLELSGQPELSTWPLADRGDFIRQVVLFNPFDPRLGELSQVVGRLAEGRRRVAATQDPGSLDQLLYDARVPPLRRALIARAVDEHASHTIASWLSLTELLRLGGADSGAADALGASAVQLRACLCLAQPPHLDWSAFEGRAETVTWLSAGSADLLLRLGDALAARHIPATAMAAILPTAARWILDHAHPSHWGDWEALSRYAAAMSDRQIDDLISAATAQQNDLIQLDLDERN